MLNLELKYEQSKMYNIQCQKINSGWKNVVHFTPLQLFFFLNF